MIYFLLLIILIFLEIFYFKIADKYNIIDKPNHRSAHTEITLRGGGVVYPLVFVILILKLLLYPSDNKIEDYLIFGIGLLSIATISFLDDIYDLSSKVRLAIHFFSVSILIYFLGLFKLEYVVWLIPSFIIIIGIINAYNFMDGINGMTGLYSLFILGSFYYVNQQMVFISDDFIIYPIIASLVFLFFNFRKKAKCFAGDVGSLSIAFWVLAIMGLLILKTNDFKYIFFLTVYGVEVIFTIIQRIFLKQNIFEAHRHHLYQLLANELKWSHLLISAIYSGIQLSINFVVVLYNLSFLESLLWLAIPISIIYIIIKYFIYLKKGVY